MKKLFSLLAGLALVAWQLPMANAMEPPTIQLLTPNGGEVWQAGTTQTLSWINGGFTDIQLDYRTSDTAPWQLIVTGLTNYDPSTYAWVVPNTPTATAMVRVKGYFSGGGPAERYDSSDNYFAILAPVPSKTLTVVRPNGGETWKMGSWERIKWTSTGIDPKAWLKIELNRGGNWQTIGLAPNVFGAIPWHVTGPKTNTALVRISLLVDPTINDVSDHFFRISNK